MASGKSANTDSRKKHPLARWRALRGLTQQQLADESDVHVTTIARIETAGQLPTVDVAIRIATALDGVMVEWIWGDAEGVELRLDAWEVGLRDPEAAWTAYKTGLLDAVRETKAELGLSPLKPLTPRTGSRTSTTPASQRPRHRER